jgi:hypothetical protein
MLETIARLAGTGGGDIYISEEGLVLSGYTESSDSTEILYKYKTLPSKDFHTYKILPSSTVLFETLMLPSLNPNIVSDSSIHRRQPAWPKRLNHIPGMR